jgi:hypothetical protein
LSFNSDDLRKLALALWALDRSWSVVVAAWAAFDLDFSDREVKWLLVTFR